MNYIWELLIKTMQDGLNPNEIHFAVFNNSISPHLEMLVDTSLQTQLNYDLISQVDVNPYIRFSNIFNKFVAEKLYDTELNEPFIDILEYKEFNKALSDVILHYLAWIDIMTGMSKRDFYVKFIVSDMENGIFENIDTVNMLTSKEKYIIANQLLILYSTFDYLACMMDVFAELFPFCQVIIRDNEEVVFYCREPISMEIKAKMQFVIKLFLPVYTNFVIHWENTYGMIGHDETMKLEEFVL